MARSERAKELAAKQKAEAKALREAKRNSSDPRDWGKWRQLKETFKMTAEYDKSVYWMVGLAVVIPLIVITALFVGLGNSRFDWIWGIVTGLLAGISAGLFVLTRRAKKASYLRFKGQPGAGEVALQMLNTKKYTYTAAITFNRQKDTVHRVLGPSGVILIGDGSPARLKQTLASETRRHEQVLYGVPVTAIQIGDEGEGQIPLEQVAKHIEKMPKTLDKLQIEEAASRLHALDSMRSRVPLPKGPIPTARGSRRALRGR